MERLYPIMSMIIVIIVTVIMINLNVNDIIIICAAHPCGLHVPWQLHMMCQCTSDIHFCMHMNTGLYFTCHHGSRQLGCTASKTQWLREVKQWHGACICILHGLQDLTPC